MALFTAAKRQNRKLKACFDGPAGSGKSYTAMRLAQSLIAVGMATRIAAIDTENESLSLYAGEAPDGKPWAFDTMNLQQFSPSQYTYAIKEAEKAGYDCIVIDGLSQAWVGKGGTLDQVDAKGGNSFTAWKDITPIQRAMVDAVVQSPIHIIATMRSKTEYVLTEETNKAGKTVTVPKKIGMAPVQRDGLEYEFDVYGCLDWSNMIHISKSRCSAMQGLTECKPGPAFWTPLFDWLRGIEVNPAAATQTRDAIAAALCDRIKATNTKTEFEAAMAGIAPLLAGWTDDEKSSIRATAQARRELIWAH